MKYSLFFPLGFAFLACQPNYKSSDYCQEFSLDSFEIIDLTHHASELISSDSISLLQPSQICYLSDGILAISDNRKENLLWLIDIDQGTLFSGINVGHGPEETGSISNMWVKNDTLWFFGLPEGKVGYVDILLKAQKLIPHIVTKSPVQALKAIGFGDTKFLYQDLIPECRFLWQNTNNTSCDTVGIFPDVLFSDDITPRNSIFQTCISASPDEEHLVQVNKSWNKIEIYDKNMIPEHLLTGPVAMESTVKKIELPFGVQYVQDPFVRVFTHVSASDDQFVVGYIEKDRDEAEVGSRCLLSFDWCGKPLKMYRFSDEIFAFDIDFETMTLYAIQQSPDPCVRSYSLQ